MFQRLFLSPTRYPNLKQTLQQSSLFLHFFKDLQKSKFCTIRFGISFPEIYFKKFINFESSSQIYIKIEEFDCLLENQQFVLDYILKKFNYLLLLLVSALLLIFTASNFWSFIFAIAFVFNFFIWKI